MLICDRCKRINAPDGPDSDRIWSCELSLRDNQIKRCRVTADLCGACAKEAELMLDAAWKAFLNPPRPKMKSGPGTRWP